MIQPPLLAPLCHPRGRYVQGSGSEALPTLQPKSLSQQTWQWSKKAKQEHLPASTVENLVSQVTTLSL